MGRKTKTGGKTRLDKYYKLAKELGYRARSAFKLIQLNKKYDFLGSSRSLVDLCAAPGGWLQVAVKHMPVGSKIIGVDLAPIRPIKGCVTFINDITTPACRAEIKKELNGGLVEVVVHDGAPNVGGAWAKEAYLQAALTLEALRLATDVLQPGGWFVTKIFRSEDYFSLMFAFRQLFEGVYATKPTSSRNTSAEIFVVCKGYKAPKSIDPKFLDPKHLFKQLEDEDGGAEKVDVLRQQPGKAHKNREGYGPGGAAERYKACGAMAFLRADNPVEMLGLYGSIDLSGDDCADVRLHAATTAEVKALCEDLKVLAPRDFKALLRWRIKARDVLKDELAAQAAAKKEQAAADGKDVDSEPEDENEALLKEMGRLYESDRHRAAQEKKRRRRLLERERTRRAAKLAGEGPIDGGDEELFSMAAAKARGAGGAGGATLDAVGEDDGHSDTDSDAAPMEEEEPDYGSDEEAAYQGQVEEYLDALYDRYKEARGAATGQGARRRARNLAAEGGDEEGLDGDAHMPEPMPGYGVEVFDDSDAEEEDAGAADRQKRQLQQWYSQDVFAGMNGGGEAGDHEGAVEEGSDEEEEEEEGGAAERRVRFAAAPSTSARARGGVPAAPEYDPEVGAFTDTIERFDSSDSDSDAEEELGDEFDQLPDEEKAAIRAHARRMKLEGRKARDAMIESGYNRYTFHDDAAPEWLLEDERKHFVPMSQVTAEEVAAEKEYFKKVNARPIKKIAEAKNRQKRRAHKALEKAKANANAIAEGEGSQASKAKRIASLMAKAKANAKGGKGQAGKGKKGSGKKFDSRMKADMRGQKAAERRNAKRGGAKKRR